ncbi:MAG TPA: dihydrofolate reductase family protein, partial [Puia sp.]|nr:dihydrofolate reductase family protein [Puia sp.]
MRKLKLQVQISVDGFIGGPNGEMDWLTWSWNDDIKNYVTELTDSVDTILLGRKMAGGFIGHWSNVLANPADESYPFAKKMIDKPKVVFTKTLDKSEWENTTLAKGELADEIKKLKSHPGKDIIVYGGAGFDSSLIKEKLVDEFHLFLNPAVIGEGLPIFKNIS